VGDLDKGDHVFHYYFRKSVVVWATKLALSISPLILNLIHPRVF